MALALAASARLAEGRRLPRARCRAVRARRATASRAEDPCGGRVRRTASTSCPASAPPPFSPRRVPGRRVDAPHGAAAARRGRASSPSPTGGGRRRTWCSTALRRADDRPDRPLARAAAARARLRPRDVRSDSARTASSRRTATLAPRRHAARPRRQLALALRRRDGDRLPRPRLERRRPPGEPAGGGRRAGRPRRARARSSATYDTDPVGEILDQPSFLNACLRIDTDLDPEALLDACKAVERELGRAAEHAPPQPAADRRRPAAARRPRAPLAAADAAPRAGARPALRPRPAARARLRAAHPGRRVARRGAGRAAGRRGRAARGRPLRVSPS